MKREDMVCAKCIKFFPDTSACCDTVERYHIDDPDIYFCGQGTWQQWSERWGDLEDYRWGEWEEEPPK